MTANTVSDLAELPQPWSKVFDEAWRSFRAGNYGIGAALIDPKSGSVVALGRNHVHETDRSAGPMTDSYIAHAEMNAFASMGRPSALGLHLYTTLEPCLMCAATAIQLRVAHVHFAACDEFFTGLDELWAMNEFTKQRRPERTGPLAPRIARFARLLPMSFSLKHWPGQGAATAARRDEPELADLAERLAMSDEFTDVRAAPSATDAFDLLVPYL